MQWGHAILLSVALAVDAAVVAFAVGLIHPDKSWRPAWKMAAWFGGFQLGMAFAGYTVVALVPWLNEWASRASAIIFILLGAKLALDVFQTKEGHVSVPTTLKAHFLLALATSLDALAAGVGLVSFSMPYVVMVMIGAVAFTLTLSGMLASHRLQHLPEAALEIGGALILIFLGAKSLLW